MNSRSVGRQTATVANVPAAVANDAEDAAFLASGYGLVPDEWQQNVLDGWLGRRSDNKWSSSRCGLSVPRQNGKNGVLEMVELFQMIVLGRKILHTAHEVKTARKAFLRLVSFFENERMYPELAELVSSIRKTNGQEAIVLANGGSCEFIARSKGSGRGFTVDTLVMDEAQELSEEALAALLPTISSAPSKNPQQIMMGTPPGPTSDGEAFSRMRNDGVEGSDRRLCWLEWSAPSNPDLDDEDMWMEANPSLGNRLLVDTVRDERASMDDITFMRERLGMWSTSESQRVIPQEDWDGCAVRSADDDGSAVALAVDVSPARTSASITACGMSFDDRPWVDLIENRRGTPEWIIDRVVAICEAQDVRAVVIDARGPAASLIDQFKRRGIKVTTTGPSQMAAAVADFYDSVMSRNIAHLNQTALSVSVAVGRKRRLGDSWAWNRKDADSDITPLVSATLALWGLRFSNVKRPARKKKSESRKVMVL